ncbi:MAG: acyltransferase family protein [Bacteroidaceae bacterium]|nr:acyltransferase family protein [Bacteroidaceae bacterium]
MNRHVWIDWMRVTACLMVLTVHSTEPFYLGGEGSLILTAADAYWVSLFDTFVRACVPLFVVASSYLQFPIHYSTGQFLRRRALRVVVPFVVWTLVYAIVWGEPVENLQSLLLNFNYAAGHLWFVYMLVGLYLLMPLLSPWAERVKKRELQFYLALCFLTTLLPFVRAWVGGEPPVMYGPTGIPNPAYYPLWGEASWNAYGLFYYFCGFLGYMLLGLYLRRFVGEWSWRRTLSVALPMWLVGFAICFCSFLWAVDADAHGVFPVEGPTGLAAVWETTWINDTASVALMTVGWVLLFRKFTASGRFFQRIILPVSKASYGVYLCHMLLLALISGWLRSSLGIGTSATLGIWTTPIQILATALITFSLASLFCVLVQRIPRLGKYLVG